MASASYLLGIVLLLIVVALWTSSNFITQNLFDDGYNKPFLVTYMNTAAFSFYLIPQLVKRYRGRSFSPAVEHLAQYEPVPTDIPQGPPKQLLPMTSRETANLAAIFCLFWFIANWTLNASLEYTSVASSTILASTSGFFTLILGRLFRVETFSLIRLTAVTASFFGVLLVSLADSNTPRTPSLPTPDGVAAIDSVHPNRRPLLGDFLTLLSAVFYAVYVILLKVRIQDESRINMQLFFGFVGLFNIIACWPIIALLDWARLEPFELPISRKQWAAVLVNMAITLSSDYLYVLAMLKTTPLVVTVGISVTIPCALFGDTIFTGTTAPLQVVAGAILVIVGFLAIGVEDSIRDVWNSRRLGGEEITPTDDSDVDPSRGHNRDS